MASGFRGGPYDDADPGHHAPRSVLHVTEASSAGTLASLSAMARHQVERGARIFVLIVRSEETPTVEELRSLLGSDVVLIEIESVGRGAALVSALGRRIIGACQEYDPEIVHLHSTWAGVAGRLALAATRWRNRVVYSPHGFAFLRRDVPKATRLLYRFAELLLARVCRGLILVSDAEEQQARRLTRSTAVVRNRVEIVEASPPDNGAPLVVSLGRISYQKAPWRFRDLASELSEDAMFVWVGDGDAKDRSRWIDGSPVRVSGWLSPAEAREALKSATVFVLLSLWEGLPMALLEAQALGIPAVVSNIPPHQEVVIHDETGFLCATDTQAQRAVETLLADSALRWRMGEAARKRMQMDYNPDSLAGDLSSAYRKLLPGGSR